MEFVYHAHSGLRYLVLLAGVVAAVILAVGVLSPRPYGRGARIATAAFVGLLDLQVLLGLLTLAVRPFYPQLMGHVVMMLLAAGAAHVLPAMGRRATDPRRKYALSLAGVAVALLLVVGGIMSIGRGVFESTIG